MKSLKYVTDFLLLFFLNDTFSSVSAFIITFCILYDAIYKIYEFISNVGNVLIPIIRSISRSQH